MQLLTWDIPREEGSASERKLMGRDDFLAWADGVPNTYGTNFADVRPIEYVLGARCKDTEVAEATDTVIRAFIQAVTMYRLGAGGDAVPLIWRIKPDMDTWTGEVAEYREDGPDMDYVTDKRCVIDKSIVFVKARARFVADTFAPGTIVARTLSDPVLVPPGWEEIERRVIDNVVMVRKQ